MPDYKRIELLVKVAKLYYENDYSQEMIAKKLGLSRPYISKLLNESKSNGIVKVQVIDPLSIETPLEKNLREHFGLEKVRMRSDVRGNCIPFPAWTGSSQVS